MDTPREWLAEAFKRMQDEIEHCVEHMEKDEFASIMLHCLNFRDAAQAVFENAQKIADPDEALEAHRIMHERLTGHPHIIMQLPNGIMAILPEDVEVPEDLSEINGEG